MTRNILTAKQERFAQAIALGKYPSQVAAYKAIYDHEGLDDTAIENASRLCADSNVAARVETIRNMSAKLTLEDHLSELARLKDVASKDGVHGAAVRAEELRGKVAGFYTEKLEINEGETDSGDVVEHFISLIETDDAIRSRVIAALRDKGLLKLVA